MEPVKLGIIGCGGIGPTHLSAAQQSQLTDVVAVADWRLERREYAQAQGVPRVYEDGRELIRRDPEVEAVILALPTCGRAALALCAFACGKHVLTEKPVAMNAHEVESMIAARGDLVAGCCSSRYRCLESARQATELVASGVLGRLRTLRVRVIEPAGPPTGAAPAPWRESFALNAGGILTNWGCYDLDYLLGIAGWSFQPRTVLAQTWPCGPQFRHFLAPESDAEAYCVALVLGEDGTVLSLERGEFMPTQGDEAWQIVGTDGSLSLPFTGDKLVHDTSSREEGMVSRVIWEANEETDSNFHLPLIEDFALTIREHRSPATSLEQALIIAKITDAIYESARTGRAVEVR